VNARWLASPWLAVRVEIALGALFVAAALPKILDPPSFAHMIYNYRILPGPLVNVMALVLPWSELLAGLGLILGLFRGGSSLLITGFLLVFVAAISWNLFRGNAIECGCFDVSAAGWSEEKKLAAMRWDLWRDAGMLLLAGISLLATYERDRGGAN
jgi:uncharacterized membrane protein YphA (DoxX/SURF4 family)